MGSVCTCDQCGFTIYDDHLEDGDKDYCDIYCYLQYAIDRKVPAGQVAETIHHWSTISGKF